MISMYETKPRYWNTYTCTKIIYTVVILLFADDMVLFSESRIGLQNGINRLNSYCIDWGLQVNVNKTK